MRWFFTWRRTFWLSAFRWNSKTRTHKEYQICNTIKSGTMLNELAVLLNNQLTCSSRMKINPIQSNRESGEMLNWNEDMKSICKHSFGCCCCEAILNSVLRNFDWRLGSSCLQRSRHTSEFLLMKTSLCRASVSLLSYDYIFIFSRSRRASSKQLW